MKTSAIAILVAMGSLLIGPDAHAACAPGGFVGYDGTTLTVDTTGCSVVAVDSVTQEGTLLSAGQVGVFDAAGNYVQIVPGGVVTNGVFVATDGATQQTVVHQGGLLTQDAGGNASVVSATAIGTTDGTNTTVITAGGVATSGTVSANGVVANTVQAGVVQGGVGAFNVLATQDSNGNIYGNVGDTLSSHNAYIGDLYSIAGIQGTAINAHSALLSDHSKRLDKHEKGIAMAIALPDLYLTEKERFSVAGNLGFFGDETAVAFGAAARLSETWSLNGGLTSDTEFKEIGGKVGIRAGW